MTEGYVRASFKYSPTREDWFILFILLHLIQARPLGELESWELLPRTKLGSSHIEWKGLSTLRFKYMLIFGNYDVTNYVLI